MGRLSKAQQAAETRKYQEARRREAEEKQKKQTRLMWQIILGALALILILTIVPIALGSINNKADGDKTEDETHDAPEMSELDMSSVLFSDCTETKEVTDYVLLNVSYTNEHGLSQTEDIIIRLYDEVAPKTVANFQSLVKSGFYDGLTFHRVMKDFMIQGGDPKGDGTGSSTPIKGEMTKNGFENNLSHVRGVVSMARRGDDYNSGSCQFFIVHQDYYQGVPNAQHLDSEYASFGFVVYGMETVDAIANTEVQVDPDYKGNNPEESSPVHPITINYATFVSVNK